ncbi:LysR substrate-binding domain-containing protein [Wukongibacter sp. M2B1]|uniref:LysR substrate-binding domain-containing protein n=1 Tax=Wukongibacter sp. M2B1 TaxID=3088895 RepID=UPI003D7BED33
MKYKGITLLQIDYFFAVAKYLNFTEAAKSLYVTQPSLSKQIALLEKEIGAQLFFRTTRDVCLTPAGIVLLKELKGILKLIESAIEKSRMTDMGEENNLTIGCLEAMDTRKFLPAIMKKLKSKYPKIKIVFERHTFKVLREKLINGTLDIIFTLSFEIDESLGILCDTVYKQNSSIVMGKSNSLALRPRLTLSDLRDEDFIMISRDESPNGFDGIVGLCRKHGFSPRVVKQLPNVESLLLCVESGLGVALVDSNIRTYNNDNIEFFNIEDDFVSVVMAWKKGNMNPVVSMFTNSIFREIEL